MEFDNAGEDEPSKGDVRETPMDNGGEDPRRRVNRKQSLTMDVAKKIRQRSRYYIPVSWKDYAQDIQLMQEM
jgi:hypothetical protein